MAVLGEYIYDWPRPMVTVDALIFAVCDNRKSVLLIKRGNDPYKDSWAVPGGFVEMDEELETAAERELFEETKIKVPKLKQMHTFGTVGRDPRDRSVTVVFTGTVDNEIKPTAGDDAAQAKWFDINNLPRLAFDHDKVIAMGIGL